jgi:hypothetical protein
MSDQFITIRERRPTIAEMFSLKGWFLSVMPLRHDDLWLGEATWLGPPNEPHPGFGFVTRRKSEGETRKHLLQLVCDEVAKGEWTGFA